MGIHVTIIIIVIIMIIIMGRPTAYLSLLDTSLRYSLLEEDTFELFSYSPS
jgi:hypothetical protein